MNTQTQIGPTPEEKVAGIADGQIIKLTDALTAFIKNASQITSSQAKTPNGSAIQFANIAAQRPRLAALPDVITKAQDLVTSLTGNAVNVPAAPVPAGATSTASNAGNAAS